MFFGWESVDRKQVLDLLIQVRELFASPNNWLFWPLATDTNDQEVDPLSDQATKWSLMGACDKLTGNYSRPLAGCISCAAREYLNDLTSDDLIHGKLDYQKEIDLLNLAIEELEKEVSNER